MDRPPEQAPVTAAAHAGTGDAGEAAGSDPGRRSAGRASGGGHTTGAGHTPGHAGIPHIGGDQECLLCPVCVALQALSSARPEVTAHLIAAGRELTMALKALLDASLDSTSPAAAADRGASDPPTDADAGDPAPRLRRITLD